jgi:hypothetical protein
VRELFDSGPFRSITTAMRAIASASRISNALLAVLCVVAVASVVPLYWHWGQDDRSNPAIAPGQLEQILERQLTGPSQKRHSELVDAINKLGTQQPLIERGGITLEQLKELLNAQLAAQEQLTNKIVSAIGKPWAAPVEPPPKAAPSTRWEWFWEGVSFFFFRLLIWLLLALVTLYVYARLREMLQKPEPSEVSKSSSEQGAPKAEAEPKPGSEKAAPTPAGGPPSPNSPGPPPGGSPRPPSAGGPPPPAGGPPPERRRPWWMPLTINDFFKASIGRITLATIAVEFAVVMTIQIETLKLFEFRYWRSSADQTFNITFSGSGSGPGTGPGSVTAQLDIDCSMAQDRADGPRMRIGPFPSGLANREDRGLSPAEGKFFDGLEKQVLSAAEKFASSGKEGERLVALVLVGAADRRNLVSTRKIYGTNHGLAQARSEWVRQELVKHSKLAGTPIVVLSAGPSIFAVVSDQVKDLELDRAVQICAFRERRP